jgi:hypothetical protein
MSFEEPNMSAHTQKETGKEGNNQSLLEEVDTLEH